jgi:CRISPR-associated protein Csm1
MNDRPPSLHEVVVGAFLHDIGKLGQRALSEEMLRDWVRGIESELLPLDAKSGRYSHRHVLFTEQFFAEVIANRRPAQLCSLDLNRAREAAVYHHKPIDDRPWTWLVAEADRLASGMERKERDIAEEAGLASGRSAFRTTPLLAIQSRIQLTRDAGRREPAWYQPQALAAEALLPVVGSLQASAMELGYRELWKAFCDGFSELRRAEKVDHLHQGLLSLSEQLLWSVPSSTKDEPDVSLHDHAVAVAAIAACLYRFHEAEGSLDDLSRIKDRKASKFRLLEGDLSGIQDTLFRLQRQQVRGINRILRGRSFRLQVLTEAAALEVRRALDLPPYVTLLRAGGHFTMLVPDLPKIEETIA